MVVCDDLFCIYVFQYDKEISSINSTLINKSYQTLMDDEMRASYIIGTSFGNCHNTSVPCEGYHEEVIITDPELLMDVFEMRSQVLINV